MKDRVIVDTSVWISYLQTGTSPVLTDLVDEQLSISEIYVPKIVLAELIQGAHSQKDITMITDFLDAFYIVGEEENTWSEAGRLSYALKKKGKTVNLADCYIAVMAKEHECAILTLDKHFKDIQKETHLKLLSLH